MISARERSDPHFSGRRVIAQSDIGTCSSGLVFRQQLLDCGTAGVVDRFAAAYAYPLMRITSGLERLT